MADDNKNFFNDLGKFASAAFESAASIKRDIGEQIAHTVETIIKRMNFATRDEVESVNKIAKQAKKDLAEIKKLLGAEFTKDAEKPAANKKKPATKKSTATKTKPIMPKKTPEA